MPEEDFSTYYKALEIDEGASPEEIKQAYLHLKKLYSTDSPITQPIDDEYPGDKKQRILKQIEEAYRVLSVSFVEKEEEKEIEKTAAGQAAAPDADTLPETVIEIPGAGPVNLKTARENMNLSLESLSLLVDIPSRILQDIELENFAALPEAGVIRWYVLTIAKHLKLDPKEITEVYMTRYREWKKGNKP